MARVPWEFYDPLANAGAGETWVLPVNPSDGGTPPKRRTLSEETTLSPNGQTVVWEGRRPAQRLEFSGTIRTEEQYDKLYDEWFEKGHQVRITDDLAREFWVIFEEIDPKRKRASYVPWKHEYSMRCLIVNNPTPAP